MIEVDPLLTNSKAAFWLDPLRSTVSFLHALLQWVSTLWSDVVLSVHPMETVAQESSALMP